MRYLNLLTAVGLNNTNNNEWDECGPCPVFASFTLAFALQLRKKHGKTQGKTLQNPQKHTHYKTPTH